MPNSSAGVIIPANLPEDLFFEPWLKKDQAII